MSSLRALLFCFFFALTTTVSGLHSGSNNAQGLINTPTPFPLLTEHSTDRATYAALSLDSTYDLIFHDAQTSPFNFANGLKTTLQTLHDLKTKPPCEAVVTADLIHACSTLSSSVTSLGDGDEPILLEDEKNLYAARLALCELRSASAAIPPNCDALKPVISKPKKQQKWSGYFNGKPNRKRQAFSGERTFTNADASECINALSASPQTWTSYSSARQNAATMCVAARTDIDKEEKIELYEKMTFVTTEVSGVLTRSAEEAEMLRTDLGVLTNSIRVLQVELAQADEERLAAAKQYLAEWEAASQASLRTLSQGVHTVQASLGRTNERVLSHGKDIDVAFAAVRDQTTGLSTHYRESLQDVTGSMELLREKLAYLQEHEVQALLQEIGRAGQDVASTNALMMTNYGLTERNVKQAADLGVWLDNMDLQMNTLATKVEQIESAIERAQECMQAQANATIEMLEVATRQATTLGDALGRITAGLEWMVGNADFVMWFGGVWIVAGWVASRVCRGWLGRDIGGVVGGIAGLCESRIAKLLPARVQHLTLSQGSRDWRKTSSTGSLLS